MEMMDFVYRKAGDFYNKHIEHIDSVILLIEFLFGKINIFLI
jgi:hypothetical protein